MGADYPDLIQAGVIGLIAALERFDIDRVKSPNAAFYVLAKWHIFYEIQCCYRKARGITRASEAAQITPQQVAEIFYSTLSDDGGFGASESRLDLQRMLDHESPEDVFALLFHSDGFPTAHSRALLNRVRDRLDAVPPEPLPPPPARAVPVEPSPVFDFWGPLLARLAPANDLFAPYLALLSA